MIHNLARGVRAFTSNVFLVTGSRPAIVDAGDSFDVVRAIREHDVDLGVVVLTHAHPDHVGNLSAIRDAFDVEVYGFDATLDVVDRPIADETAITLGDHEYVALHTPGHRDDHLCLYAPEPAILFSGDLCFADGGFGRTDLPGGERERLVESIDRVASLVGDDLAELHPGHGPSVDGDASEHVELARRAARLY